MQNSLCRDGCAISANVLQLSVRDTLEYEEPQFKFSKNVDAKNVRPPDAKPVLNKILVDKRVHFKAYLNLKLIMTKKEF